MTDETERVRELYEESLNEVFGYARGTKHTELTGGPPLLVAALAKRLQPKPSDHGISEMEAGFMQLRQDNNDLRKRLDDLTQRLNQPTPAPKVWSVSEGTCDRHEDVSANLHRLWTWYRRDKTVVRAALNAIVDDILRDRPDAVAKEWERRAKASPLYGAYPEKLPEYRRTLFPEVEG